MANRANTIIKNTMFLYLRSIVIMILAIYTSRVMLYTLGVDDFGIYNVVGGIVAMFSSIKSVLASVVQRFVNFEKGRGNDIYVNKIFNSSIWIHIILGFLFVLLIEPIGGWFIKNKLVIPDGALDGAFFVFHCSVATTFFTIITIPYEALVIANEKMSFYALTSIIEAGSKLAIVFCLPLFPFEYLKSFAFLLFLSIFVVRIWIGVYCLKFPEAEFHFDLDKMTVKEMGSFAGWNFMGCTASSLIEEGSNLILNAFGGVVANAARGIAYQVKSAVTIVASNVVVASQPFITQQSAIVEKEKFFSYIYLQSRLVFYCVSITVLPIYVYSEKILSIWLKDIPQNTVDFVQSVLIYVLVLCFQKSIDLAYKSYGKIVRYQIVDTLLALTTLPTIYIILSANYPLHYAFYGFSIVRVLDYAGVLLLARKELGLSMKDYLKKVVFPCSKTLLIMIALVYLFSSFAVASSIVLLISYSILIVLSCCLLLYFVIFNDTEKQLIKAILSKYHRSK